jgi:hypothetical protein
MNVWDWGNQSVEPTASAITPPPAHCSACQVELAPLAERFFVDYGQRLHHQMWFRVGEPPGTLIAWDVKLSDQGGKVNRDGTPVMHSATIYAVRVDWWNHDWRQRTFPWSVDPSSPRLVVLGARVYASPSGRGSWIFRWLWPNPAWPEACLLDPPHADLTDEQAVRLNHARRAFYAFAERRGIKSGMRIAWPQDEATWHEAGTAARRAIVVRGHQPTDGTLAAEMGIRKATFDRRKRDWGSPDVDRWRAEQLRQLGQS